MQNVILNHNDIYDRFYRYYCVYIAILEKKLSESVKFYSNKQNTNVPGESVSPFPQSVLFS